MVVHKPSLMSMPFKSLSARMLSMFIAQFSLMLRLLAIAMTFTTDTFGCERLISLVIESSTTCRQCSKPEWSTIACHGVPESGSPLRCIDSHTRIGKRPCRGWIAVGTRIVDVNVTTMHRRHVGVYDACSNGDPSSARPLAIPSM